MLRRHADGAFWLGRYVERAESTARMVDVHYHWGLESNAGLPSVEWDSILTISGLEDDFHARYPSVDEDAVLHFFAFDLKNPSSVMSCLASARENARSVRGQISSEMWESVNRWYLEMREWDLATMERRSVFDFFHRVKDGSHLFHGITTRTQPIGEARDFFNLGQFVERADQTARILDVRYQALADAEDTHRWLPVLRSVGAREAYLKTYRQGVSADRVAEFLVMNPNFPASILYCVSRMQHYLRRISGNGADVPANAAEREAGRLYSDLLYLTLPEIEDDAMHDFLEDVQRRFADVTTAVWETYLSY